MSTSIRKKVIDTARAEVGYVRKASRWNKYAADVYPSVQYQAYCGVFVAWVLKQAGVDARDVLWLPYVPYIESWAKKNGAWITKAGQQRDGDLVVYGFGRSSGQHVGIVWRDEKASGYRAIEGNTSAGTAGSQANGGRVAVRYRGRASIRGWVDLDKLIAAAGGAKPVTSAKKETSGKLEEDGRLGKRTAQELQQRLRTRDLDLDVDAMLGPDSIRAMQAFLRAPYIDGEVSRQPKAVKDLGNGYRKDCFLVGDGKSPFIERWQAYVGAKVDGRLGEKTIAATQKLLNSTGDAFTKAHDGEVDKKVKAAKL